MSATEGTTAPAFTLEDASGGKCSLADFDGKWLVVYFYPKDDTPGCTREACAFRDTIDKVKALKAEVVGISPDDAKSHAKFARKYSLPFTLLCDPEHEVAEKYEVWREKVMYGIKKMGIERSTFVIAPDGKIAKAWRKVKVDNHADEVLKALKDAQAKSS
jgi:thioredoxin-dependent peroxiredoxin